MKVKASNSTVDSLNNPGGICLFESMSVNLTGDGVVSLLLVHRDLSEPGSRCQQLDFVTTAKLVLSVHFAFLLSAPVNVVLEYTHTERVSHIYKKWNK